jgi:predicted outer membrane protein
MPSKMPVGQSGGRPWWCAASTVNVSTPNTEVTKVEASAGAGRTVENDEYAAFARRVLKAYARRVADGDVEALALMLGLAAEIDTAISQAVKGLREFGYSWAEIGARLGITRQAAQQRRGHPA